MGHILVPHDRGRDPFAGCCPWHGDCLEGLASGTALRERWGRGAETLAAEHPAWELEAEYLAAGLMSLVCALSPERVIVGGGVMRQRALLGRVREKLKARLNGYLQAEAIEEKLESYVVAPALGENAGVLGALALAAEAAG
jgi:fructokinase